MNIQTFEIRKQINGIQIILYPTLLTVHEKNYLIDCGYEETFQDFVKELKKLNVDISDLYAIIISHDDIDHIGALKLFKENNPGLKIYSSEIEAPSISGEIKSERLEQAERFLLTLPEEYKASATMFISQLKSIARVQVSDTLKDKDTIDGEVVTILTPGHTKGHISIYIPEKKTLIANDALVIEADDFEIANPQFTLDMNQAIRSVELIKKIDPEIIICYHGGVARKNVSQKLASLLAKYKNYSTHSN
jgi:glyoxylase-like metal-dependent hydrolase (beta-lactamase superfamily II)